MARKRFTERWVIQTLLFQGTNIPCFRCKKLFNADDDIEREHVIEIALGGADEPFNCSYSHAACHATITNGTPATTAGSSKNRIAKARPARAEKLLAHKIPLDADLVSEPSGRCRKCGQEPCQCQVREKRSGFQR